MSVPGRATPEEPLPQPPSPRGNNPARDAYGVSLPCSAFLLFSPPWFMAAAPPRPEEPREAIESLRLFPGWVDRRIVYCELLVDCEESWRSSV